MCQKTCFFAKTLRKKGNMHHPVSGWCNVTQLFERKCVKAKDLALFLDSVQPKVITCSKKRRYDFNDVYFTNIPISF